MKKTLLPLIISLFTVGFCFAQNIKSYRYKGTIDGKLTVTLFINTEDNDCTPDLAYRGMYRYDNVSKWLQLDITESRKNEFAMVEYAFTGLMILKKKNASFSGLWISPDGKRQLKVIFNEVPLTDEESKKYMQKLDEVNYENHGC